MSKKKDDRDNEIRDDRIEDVSRIVARISVTVDGKDYIVGPFGYEDWSVVQTRLLFEKRGRMINAVKAARQFDPDMTDAEYQAMRREALDQAGNTTTLGPEDADDIVATPDGMGTVLWAMIEREYKGDMTRPNRAACQKGVMTAFKEELDGEILAAQVLACMGIEYQFDDKSGSDGKKDNAGTVGNENGQTSDQVRKG